MKDEELQELYSTACLLRCLANQVKDDTRMDKFKRLAIAAGLSSSADVLVRIADCNRLKIVDLAQVDLAQEVGK